MRVVRGTTNTLAESVHDGLVVREEDGVCLYRVMAARPVAHPVSRRPRVWLDLYQLDNPTRSITWVLKPHDSVTVVHIVEDSS